MQQKMSEEELELLKQVQEDLDIAKEKYGCTVNREDLLKGVLERNEHPVKPEEAELFFSGVLPSGWKNCYFREPKMLSASMVKLRKAISVQWCKDYLEPELRVLKGCESLRDCQISMSQMKKDLNLPLRKDNMLSSHIAVEGYLREMRSKAGISPNFRFIPPDRFAKIVDIYLEAMEERGDCTQEELGRLLGMTQSAVSKLRKEQTRISTEREFRVLLCLLVLHLDLRNQQEMQSILSVYRNEYCIHCGIKKKRLFSAVYLAALLGYSVPVNCFGRTSLPATVADLNQLLKEQRFNAQFDPDAEVTFREGKPEKVEYNAIPLWSLIRLPDGPSLLGQQEVLNEIMQMDDAHLRLLYRMPEVFFTDPFVFNQLEACMYLKEMRQLRQHGLKHLMSKMETITIGWERLQLGYYCGARNPSVYLKSFFQLMEYLSVIVSIASCDTMIMYYNEKEMEKPLTEAQKWEYRVLFDDYIVRQWQRDRVEQIRLKFSMNMQEWYFWLKMGLLWWKENSSEKWRTFMNQCMEEARKADRDAAETAPNA